MEVCGCKFANRRGIEIIGYQTKERLSELYENSKFHVLPSFVETPGISNLEACSYGKPIVVGDFPVLHEYFGDSAIDTGFKCSEILKEMRVALTCSFPVEFDLSKFRKDCKSAQYMTVIDKLYD